MKKYQSGGKNSPAKPKPVPLPKKASDKPKPVSYKQGGTIKPKNFKSAQDSVQTARDISQRIRTFDRSPAYSDSATEKTDAEMLGSFLKSKGFGGPNDRFSTKDKEKIATRALHPLGAEMDREDPATNYKSGGTIKKQTMKNKPAPKKKMSTKEMEATKKGKTPMMKYGGKMKKPC